MSRFKKDSQRRACFANLRNKAKLPSRRSRSAKDHITREKESMRTDKETIREYNRRLANAGSKKEKLQLKKKIRTRKKTIARKKKTMSRVKKKDSQVHYIMKNTHSSYKDSEQLLNYANSKNVEYNEIDWDELKGADLSYEKKQKILNNQIQED